MTGLDGAISAVVGLSTAAAIAAVVAGRGADGGCTVIGAEIETRHLGMATTASGFLISAVALSGRIGTRTRPIRSARREP